jgi:hypothetical protein
VIGGLQPAQLRLKQTDKINICGSRAGKPWEVEVLEIFTDLINMHIQLVPSIVHFDRWENKKDNKSWR